MKDSLRSICTSTSGILFFGTPHNGCNKTNLAVFLKQEAEAHGLVADTDSWLLSSLETGSEFLLNITDMFEPMSKNFSVFCFREISPSDLGGRSGYVSFLLSLSLGNSNNSARLCQQLQQLLS